MQEHSFKPSSSVLARLKAMALFLSIVFSAGPIFHLRFASPAFTHSVSCSQITPPIGQQQLASAVFMVRCSQECMVKGRVPTLVSMVMADSLCWDGHHPSLAETWWGRPAAHAVAMCPVLLCCFHPSVPQGREGGGGLLEQELFGHSFLPNSGVGPNGRSSPRGVQNIRAMEPQKES